MRKKNKPIGLMVTLGVLVTGAFVYNAAQTGLFKNLGGSPKPPAGEARKTDKDYGTATANKAATGAEQMKAKAGAGKAESIAAFKKSLNGRPMLAMPKVAAYQPKPNDSSTSTQWYH